MIRGITIGQYYTTNSILHKLDPRVKLIGTISYIFSLFLINGYGGMLISGIFLAIIIVLSKVPIGYMIKGLKPIILLLIFTSLFNLFSIKGTTLIEIGVFEITREGIKITIITVIRLIFLILGSSLMTFTTTPNHLTDGLECLMKPLNKIKVPVHEIAMMCTIALRFIPILLEETDKIMKAQMARGADFESGNIIKKAKSLIPVLVPLLVSAFRRANDLAVAMEARCYQGGEGRTKMKPLHYYRRDYIGYAILIAYFTIIFTLPRFAVW